MRLKGVIFDLDGTLIDADYDWKAVRKRLGVEEGSILSNFEKMPPDERREKEAILKEIEREHTYRARLMDGVHELFSFLEKHGIKRALVTNNTKDNVLYIIKKFSLTFDVILTREDGFYKPDPSPMYEAIKRMKVSKDEVIAIGDSFLDLQAAKAASIPILILKANEYDLKGANFYYNDLYDVISYIEKLLSSI